MNWALFNSNETLTKLRFDIRCVVLLWALPTPHTVFLSSGLDTKLCHLVRNYRDSNKLSSSIPNSTNQM